MDIKKSILQVPESIDIQGTAEDREVYVNGQFLDPRPSWKIHNHSPDGFNWGYGGSGPAQLSLAILMKFMPANVAQRLYQSFKFKVVAGWEIGKDFDVKINLRAELLTLVS